MPPRSRVRIRPSDAGTRRRYAGSFVEDAVIVLLVTSLFACCLSFHNVVARYQFNLANGRVLPAYIAEVHPRTGPRRARRW